MMVIFLWILLALAVLTLIVIGSPIRFGIAVSFGKARPQRADFRISYIHPILFRYDYSSKGHRERAVFFGFLLKKKRRGEDQDCWDERGPDERDGRDDGGDRDGGYFHPADERRDARSSPDGGSNGARFSSAGSRSGAGSPADDRNRPADGQSGGRSRPADDYELLGARALRLMREMWENPLWARLMNSINDFKGHRGYKFISDKILRVKIYKWLRRSLKSILSSMRFERFKLRARVGFRDPARAGKLYGYFTAARRALIPRNRKISIKMEPVFTEECMDADIVFAGRTTIAQILSSFIVITLTFPYWRVYKIKRKDKKSWKSSSLQTTRR